MRLTPLATTFLSLLGLTQSQSTWAQTQPFTVAASTDSLLPSSSAQQDLTNIIGTRTRTSDLPPAVSVTGEFSTTIPTELISSATSAVSGSGSSSGSGSGSVTASGSGSSRASASSSVTGTGSQTQSSGAAMPGGLQGKQKVMGVAGALAGAAGVLFV